MSFLSVMAIDWILKNHEEELNNKLKEKGKHIRRTPPKQKVARPKKVRMGIGVVEGSERAAEVKT